MLTHNTGAALTPSVSCTFVGCLENISISVHFRRPPPSEVDSLAPGSVSADTLGDQEQQLTSACADSSAATSLFRQEVHF